MIPGWRSIRGGRGGTHSDFGNGNGNTMSIMITLTRSTRFQCGADEWVGGCPHPVFI